ncbi:MAG TPA: PilN domain-containing protein [Mycobacteriales bacterium]|nr:PilN domain-containing protein [Mycobacteriales bacterium]
MTAFTVQTDVEQLAGAGLATLPRVNLLPPEIAEQRRFRRIQYGLGGGVLAAVGLVAVGFVLATGSVNAANEELTTANAENARLQAETAKYADVTAVYAQAAAAQAMLTEAMGQEVRYSGFLSSLSLSIPDNVWVTSLSFSQSEVPPAVGATDPGVGTLTVAGKGFSHEDVALWLESLAGQETYVNPYFSSSTETLIGKREAVDFSSTATLTQKALSERYTEPAGG